VAVQLAALALALEVDAEMVVLMRTAPGQSYVNPVECVMSVLNLAVQSLATARAACTPETEAVLKDGSSMKQVREALAGADALLLADAAETHSARYAASMRELIA
jgi:hypothetical protein